MTYGVSRPQWVLDKSTSKTQELSIDVAMSVAFVMILMKIPFVVRLHNETINVTNVDIVFQRWSSYVSVIIHLCDLYDIELRMNVVWKLYQGNYTHSTIFVSIVQMYHTGSLLNIRISLISLQLSCNANSQIRMLFKRNNVQFCKISNVLNDEITWYNFSSSKPRTINPLPVQAGKAMVNSINLYGWARWPQMSYRWVNTRKT